MGAAIYEHSGLKSELGEMRITENVVVGDFAPHKYESLFLHRVLPKQIVIVGIRILLNRPLKSGMNIGRSGPERDREFPLKSISEFDVNRNSGIFGGSLARVADGAWRAGAAL